MAKKLCGSAVWWFESPVHISGRGECSFSKRFRHLSCQGTSLITMSLLMSVHKYDDELFHIPVWNIKPRCSWSEKNCSGLLPVSISHCTCLHGCCRSISACSRPQLSHHSAGDVNIPQSHLLNPQFSLSLAVALRDKRRPDKATGSTSGY